MTVKPSWRVVLASLFCLLLIQPVSSEEEKKGGEHDWLIKHPTIVKLLKLHNEERARNGLPSLSLNTRMCLKAQEHATWMAETGYYQHSSLPWPEIIFQGPTSAAAAVNGWIASPAHHSIMLTGSQAGFGYMVMNGQYYWVGVFQ
tara:strand:- start:114158 stop:114592 length:435 start_codon:yes stop_codon:yes gene_type:complete